MNIAKKLCLLGAVLFNAPIVGAAEKSKKDIILKPIAQGFTAPNLLVTSPGDARRFVVDQIGTIHILGSDGQPLEKPFLDLRDRMIELRESYDERGLLGLAFHPEYQNNRRFFVYYSAPLREGGPKGWNHTSHLSEFRASKDPNIANADSERVILQIDQPQMNHNGGRLVFGPDGYLFVGLGDGGSGGDLGEGHPPLGNGQDVTTLLGSILRIDIEKRPYGVPEDNPLVGLQLPQNAEYSGKEARPEIWAWGLRNPWGLSFDRQTGKLYAADVGQKLWEEINIIVEGNYGWNTKEGSFWFDEDDFDHVVAEGPTVGPMGKPFIDPVLYYKNSGGHERGLGKAIVGGYVYRGQKIPSLHGQYVFGDWSASHDKAMGTVMIATPEESKPWTFRKLPTLEKYILGFGEDADGELYVLVSGKSGPQGKTGQVLRLEKATQH